MKQKAITIEGIRFEPHWFSGYTGEINGRRVIVRQVKDRDWLVRAHKWLYWDCFGKPIGGGSTLRAAVRMAKERV